MSKILFAAAILVVSAAPMANAATAPAANATLGGPLIKGVCFLSKQAVIANTKVGQAAAERMKQLRAQVQAEIDASRGPIDADGRALQASAAKGDVAAPELERRRVALQSRIQTLQALADLRSRELQATDAKAGNRVGTEMQPIVAASYKAHGCGLLLDRTMVIDGNMGEDLTADVVKGLDAKVTTMTFDRENLSGPAKK